MKAINKKHQAVVNKAIYWLKKYNEADNLRNMADGDGNVKLYNKYNRACDKAWEKYEDYTSELPKGEVEQIEKSDLY